MNRPGTKTATLPSGETITLYWSSYLQKYVTIPED